MNNTAKYIHKTIYQLATEHCDKQQWIKYRHNVRLSLERLQPDIPDDGTVNRIAFNVGDDKPRMKIKTGRFLTKKLQLNSGYLNDETIQSIASKINFHLFGSDIEIKLINGSDITDAYEDEVGTTSCMTGCCASYTRLYESNPTRFQMLMMHYGNNSARAIVHKLDNGKYLLDRVYSDCEELKTRMRNYAIDHNWYYRVSSLVYFDIDEIDDYDEIIVSGLSYDDDEVPYMDTLTEYRLQGSEMDIFHSKASYSNDGTLDSQNGQLENRNCCENCGDTMSDDETCYVGDSVICRDCYNDNYFYCDCCNEDYHNDDGVCIEDANICVCRNCANESGKYYQCEDCNDYYSMDRLCSTVYDTYVCESCLGNYRECEGCNEYFTPDDVDENGHCEDCVEPPIPVQNENDTEKPPFKESIRNAE